MNTDRLGARARPTLRFEIERDELPSRRRAMHPPLAWLLGRKAMEARVARAARARALEETSFDDA